jgi:hypothetical protein
LSVTENVTGGVLSLPIYETLADETIKAVAQAIRDIAEYEPMRKQSSVSGRDNVAAL